VAATADLRAAALRSERWRRTLRRRITPWVAALATASATIGAVTWAGSVIPGASSAGRRGPTAQTPAAAAWLKSQSRVLQLQQRIDSDERQIAHLAGSPLPALPAAPAVHATTGASGVAVP